MAVTSPAAQVGPAGESVLSMQQVDRVYGTGPGSVHALASATLEVYRGELVAVMGPSGSGKSTLLALAGGLDACTAGTITVQGERLSTLNGRRIAALRRRRIGYVFQDFNLIPALTARENVMLPLELDGRSTRAARELAQAMLEDLGLGALHSRFPDDISGGQRQRVAIARALVGERRLLLADEPTGSLDSATGQDILRTIRDRCDTGAAAVVVTHEPATVKWADRVVVIHDGHLEEQAPTSRR